MIGPRLPRRPSAPPRTQSQARRRSSHCGLAAVAAAALVAAAACSAAPAPAGDDALALVAGAHANAPSPTLLGELATAVDRAVRSQATAAVVVNSGVPVIATQGVLRLDCNNASACDQLVNQQIGLVTTTVQTARAAQPENNLLAAIDLGARAVRDHSGTRTLGVIDSGLQTVAPLRFQDPGLLDAQPGDVAEFLAQTKALPDLSGVVVVFEGLGDTADPQQPLDTRQRANLRAIWTVVARRAGATEVRYVDTPVTGPAPAGLPPVTPVPLVADRGFPATTTGVLPDATVPFQPDSAVLRDPPGALAILAPLAQQIIASHTAVTLTGTTANVGPLDGQRSLSLQRAEAIKALLVQLGVPAQLVSTRGTGSAWPGYVPDHDAAGVLLPGPAEQNRQVIMAPTTR